MHTLICIFYTKGVYIHWTSHQQCVMCLVHRNIGHKRKSPSSHCIRIMKVCSLDYKSGRSIRVYICSNVVHLTIRRFQYSKCFFCESLKYLRKPFLCMTLKFNNLLAMLLYLLKTHCKAYLIIL